MTRRSSTKAKQQDAALPTPTLPKIPPAQVLPRLAALKTAPIAQLKQQWRELFGKADHLVGGRTDLPRGDREALEGVDALAVEHR